MSKENKDKEQDTNHTEDLMRLIDKVFEDTFKEMFGDSKDHKCGCCDLDDLEPRDRIRTSAKGKRIKMSGSVSTIPTEFRDEVLEDHPEILYKGPVTVDGVESGYTEELGLPMVLCILDAPDTSREEFARFVKANMEFSNMISEVALRISQVYADKLEKDPYFIHSLISVYAQYAATMHERAMGLKAYQFVRRDRD